MRLVTKQTDYAIRILLTMFKGGKDLFTTSGLAKKLKISKPFTRAILQKLNKEKVVISSKGKGGGFKMALPPDKISIVSLVEIFQGPVKLDRCLIRSDICPDIKTCVLKKKLKEIGNHITEEFKILTLDKLLK
ncbi:MAG: Rrf2 family transcriptional regulator [Actinobacteria bacterium]|nr:Rrf2 family transcriptional regulator [Actinomycetota bacterium]